MSFEPEALLGEQDGRALRRFLEWGVGAGFDLAIVQVTTPWKRGALVRWIEGQVPGAVLIGLDQVGPTKRRLWDVLGEATAPEKNTKLLIFERLEEAEDPPRLLAQLNVERDELVKAFALPWVMFVHPVMAQELERRAPDFADFAGIWLYEEAPEALRIELAAIDAGMRVAPGVEGEGAFGGNAVLVKAAQAIDFGKVDEASDLLAQFDLRHPEARERNPDRIAIEGRRFLAMGRFPEARVAYESALRLYDARGDRAGRAASLHVLAVIYEEQGRYDEARRLLQESIAMQEEIGHRAGRAASLHQLAIIEESQGHYDEARRLLQESIAMEEENGNRAGRAASLHQLASIDTKLGRYDEARRLLRESIAVKKEIGDRAGRASSLHQLAVIDTRLGRYDEAQRLLQESIATEQEIGDRAGRAASLHQLALIDTRLGRYDEAQRLLQESIDVKKEIGDRAGLAASFVMLGQLEVQRGNLTEGRLLVQKAVDILEEIGSGDLSTARRILARIDAMQTPPQTSTPAPPNPMQQALAQIATALQEGRAEGALDRVRALVPTLSTTPEALAVARSLEAQALTALDRGDEGLAVLDRGIEEAASAGLAQYVDALRLLRDQLEPRVERARLVATPFETIEAAIADPGDRGVVLIKKAVAHAEAGDLVTAQILLPLARAAAAEHPNALVSVLIGTLHIQAAAGDLPAARNTLAEALTLAREHEPDALPVLEEFARDLPPAS